jgi:hypothetical protein
MDFANNAAKLHSDAKHDVILRWVDIHAVLFTPISGIVSAPSFSLYLASGSLSSAIAFPEQESYSAITNTVKSCTCTKCGTELSSRSPL